MTSSRDTLDNSALASQLASTHSLIQGLLKEMRDSSVEQASLKTDLKSLRYSVSMLSNIIRGGESGARSILTEVELLKKCSEDLEEQLCESVVSLNKRIEEVVGALNKQFEEIQRKMAEAEADRKTNEALKLQLQQQEVSDRRLDKRQRLATWAGIVVALIALAGSVLALFLKTGQ
jgi:chromosome segregation ATPase